MGAAGGVATVEGYGCSVRVDGGHLELADGIGLTRRHRRYPRVGHELRRLILQTGGAGVVSFDALKWCEAAGIAMVAIDREGHTLVSSATPWVDDGRLRRTQAMAPPELATSIAHQLIGEKIAGQARVAGELLEVPDLVPTLTDLEQVARTAETIEDLRQIEAAASAAYWGAWPGRVAMAFPTRSRVPERFTRFSGRRSPLAGNNSPRLAADPINALLNYCYRLREVECRQAALALRLYPGIGIMHVDDRDQAALALDLMEPIRPEIDAFVIELVGGHVFSKRAFVERPDWSVRVLAPLTHHLTSLMPRWGKAVAPHAEAVAHAFADSSRRPIAKRTPLTGLPGEPAIPCRYPRGTRNQRFTSAAAPHAAVRGLWRRAGPPHADMVPRLFSRAASPSCRKGAGTGEEGRTRSIHAARWAASISAALAATKAAQARALGFDPSDWEASIWPGLQRFKCAEIAAATGLSTHTASEIRRGKAPHPRHWEALAKLVGFRGVVAGD